MRPKRRLGAVLHVSSSSGNLILKAESSVKIGDAALDNRGNRVGTVSDLFGPVCSPFAAVKPKVGDPERYVGGLLFSGRPKH